MLQLRVSELEGNVKRKINALKTASQRRERAEENAASEAAQAREAAQLARTTLEEAGRKNRAYRESIKDAQTRVRLMRVVGQVRVMVDAMMPSVLMVVCSWHHIVAFLENE